MINRNINKKLNLIKSIIQNKQKLNFCSAPIKNTHSYACGLGKEPLIYKTIGEALYDAAEKYPDNIAVISEHQGTKLTYQELLFKAEQIAATLHKLGCKKQDRIGIFSPNYQEWLITQYAASLGDFILVNINPAYQTHELEFCLNKVNIKCLIMSNQFKKSNYIEQIYSIAPELKFNPSPGRLKLKKLPDLQFVIRLDDEKSPGFLNFNDLYGISSNKEVDFIRDLNSSNKIDPDDATNIQFTSGTTGLPKGATLTHFNILNNGKMVGDNQNLQQNDQIIIPVPLYHCFGMVMGNLAALTRGACVIYPNDGFSAQKTLECITKYKASALYGVPTMFHEFFKEYDKNCKKYDINSLRTGVMAGSLCPEVLMKRVINEFHMKDVTICYGMTETSPVSFQTNPNDTFEQKTSTVGTILPYIEAKIVDESGRMQQLNTPGELWVRGYSVMSRYFNDDEKTITTKTKEGWLKTGDIATLDKQGYLKITGRIKDMIIRGGENIYPREIEEFLTEMPEIQQASIVGVPDQKFGEETFACIILTEGVKDFDIQYVYKFCKGKIAHYKIPKYVKVVEQYPLTVTGKIQKYILQDDLKKELDDNEQNFKKYQIRSY